jgi:hypothetical protein
VTGDVLGDGGIEFGDPGAQLADAGLGQGAQARHADGSALVARRGQGIEELAPCLDQFGEITPGRVEDEGWSLEGGGAVGDDASVDVVGLGKMAAGAGELADPPSRQNADAVARGSQGFGEAALIAARSLAGDALDGPAASQASRSRWAVAVLAKRAVSRRGQEATSSQRAPTSMPILRRV